MKNNLKLIAKFLLSWAISFLVIYLFIFFGGYKLFETDSIILKEIGVSFIMGFVIFLAFELFKDNMKKIDELEKRIEKLEKDK